MVGQRTRGPGKWGISTLIPGGRVGTPLGNLCREALLAQMLACRSQHGYSDEGEFVLGGVGARGGESGLWRAQRGAVWVSYCVRKCIMISAVGMIAGKEKRPPKWRPPS